MSYFATLDTHVVIRRETYHSKPRTVGAPFRVYRVSPGHGYEICGAIDGNVNYITAAIEPQNPRRRGKYDNGKTQWGYRTIREAKEACRKYLGCEAETA